jgi:hypothetical protein
VKAQPRSGERMQPTTQVVGKPAKIAQAPKGRKKHCLNNLSVQDQLHPIFLFFAVGSVPPDDLHQPVECCLIPSLLSVLQTSRDRLSIGRMTPLQPQPKLTNSLRIPPTSGYADIFPVLR